MSRRAKSRPGWTARCLIVREMSLSPGHVAFYLKRLLCGEEVAIAEVEAVDLVELRGFPIRRVTAAIDRGLDRRSESAPPLADALVHQDPHDRSTLEIVSDHEVDVRGIDTVDGTHGDHQRRGLTEIGHRHACDIGRENVKPADEMILPGHECSLLG